MAHTILTKRQQLLLDLLSEQEEIQKHFYLSGGTALAEYYLQHRYKDYPRMVVQLDNAVWQGFLYKKQPT